MNKYQYPYLTDAKFLSDFTELQLKEQFVRITVLDWLERPIKNIEGQVTSGSLNLDGKSNVRRTCNISFIAKEDEGNVMETKNILSINKKIKVMIGFTNTTKHYTDFDMLWFPIGVFLIIAPSVTLDSNGINISLQLKDKMCLLNGECGGVLPATMDLDTEDIILPDGTIDRKKITILDAIRNIVHIYGGEQLGKIVIEELDQRVKQVVKWLGTNSIFLVQKNMDVEGIQKQRKEAYYEIEAKNIAQLDLDSSSVLGEKPYSYTEYSLGNDIGYKLIKWIYPEELSVSAGATVASVLDTIKNLLGDWEYFYDIDGNFIFRPVKDYSKVSYSTDIIQQLSKNPSIYYQDVSSGRTNYRFDNKKIVTSYSLSPQYNMIKNDFVIWGVRKDSNGNEFPIRYHLAIDDKPNITGQSGIFSNFIIYRDIDGLQKAAYLNEQKGDLQWLNKNKEKVDVTKFYKYIYEYYYKDEDEDDENKVKTLKKESIAVFNKTENKWKDIYEDDSFSDIIFDKEIAIKANDWRTALYLKGIYNQNQGIETGYYFPELVNEWPKLYDIAASIQNENGKQYYIGQFKKEVLENPTNIDYFLDFVSLSESMQKLKISEIGRRTKVLQDNKINCVFESDIPDYVLIQKGAEDTEEIRNECYQKSYNFIQIDDSIADGLAEGGSLNSAFETVRTLLYQHTSYNESITINCLPMYYLEPNTRIFIRESEIGLEGQYIIQSMSIPLGIDGTMSISASKVIVID